MADQLLTGLPFLHLGPPNFPVTNMWHICARACDGSICGQVENGRQSVFVLPVRVVVYAASLSAFLKFPSSPICHIIIATPILHSGLSGLHARARRKGCPTKATGRYSDATRWYDAGISDCCFLRFFLAVGAMPDATTG